MFDKNSKRIQDQTKKTKKIQKSKKSSGPLAPAGSFFWGKDFSTSFHFCGPRIPKLNLPTLNGPNNSTSQGWASGENKKFYH